METTNDYQAEVDTVFCFDLTFAIHEDEEAEANKALAELLDEAEKIGFKLVWSLRAAPGGIAF